jgi:serine protease Do
MARSIAESLIEVGTVVRGYLGVQIQDLTVDMRRSLGLKKTVTGVIVALVTQDSPAEEAGIRQGDIITEYDGEQIKTASQLRNLVAATEPGTEKSVNVLRDGDDVAVTVEVGKLSDFRKARVERKSTLMGLAVSRVSAETAAQLGLQQGTGVEIIDVDAESPAAEAGLRTGDVILRVGNTDVQSPAQFKQLVETASDDGLVLLLAVDGQTGITSYVTVKVAG